MKNERVVFDKKKFYIDVFSMVIPMALQNLINVGLLAADVFMLGRVGEKALSGASLGGQIYYIMSLFLFGLTSGTTVLTAQYWGKGDKKTIEKILALGMKAAVSVTAIFMILSVGFPRFMIGIFTNDPMVVAEGAKYLRILGVSFVITGIVQTYLYVMRSVERVMVSTVIFTLSLIMNVCLNGIFIFGLFGLPPMGVVGAALGTLIARTMEIVMVFIYARLFNKEIKFRMKYFIKCDPILVKDFLTYALPVVLNEVLWGIATSANTVILGHMGSAAVAANSVAQVARQLATVVAFGVTTATAIYIGKTIGEKKNEYAKAYAKRFIVLSVILGVLGGILILVFSPFVIQGLVLTEAAKNYLRFMFFVMSYFVVAQSYNCTLNIGIFRAGGDTRFGLITDMCVMWGGSILMGSIAAFVLKLSVPVVYFILMCDELMKLPILTMRYRKYKWLNNITREMEA